MNTGRAGQGDRGAGDTPPARPSDLLLESFVLLVADGSAAAAVLR
jgi:hypothetical protein